MMTVLLSANGAPEKLLKFARVTDDVVDQARHVAGRYREMQASRGSHSVDLVQHSLTYSPGFSMSLRRLESLVDSWLEALHALHLDSDTNGFDRSFRWSHNLELTPATVPEEPQKVSKKQPVQQPEKRRVAKAVDGEAPLLCLADTGTYGPDSV